MSILDRRAHWENVYGTKAETEVSWFQENPAPSLALIELAGATHRSAIVDIGAGASRLVDSLLDRGFECVTVLDLSEAALGTAKARLVTRAERVVWLTADVTKWQPATQYDVWHDRAAFHFLTSPSDQAAYVKCLHRALPLGGHAIIGTFAPDGPEQCSGLPVVRHDAGTLASALGTNFALIDTRRHEHATPRGVTQRFQFSIFRRSR